MQEETEKKEEAERLQKELETKHRELERQQEVQHEIERLDREYDDLETHRSQERTMMREILTQREEAAAWRLIQRQNAMDMNYLFHFIEAVDVRNRKEVHSVYEELLSSETVLRMDELEKALQLCDSIWRLMSGLLKVQAETELQNKLYADVLGKEEVARSNDLVAFCKQYLKQYHALIKVIVLRVSNNVTNKALIDYHFPKDDDEDPGDVMRVDPNSSCKTECKVAADSVYFKAAMFCRLIPQQKKALRPVKVRFPEIGASLEISKDVNLDEKGIVIFQEAHDLLSKKNQVMTVMPIQVPYPLKRLANWSLQRLSPCAASYGNEGVSFVGSKEDSVRCTEEKTNVKVSFLVKGWLAQLFLKNEEQDQREEAKDTTADDHLSPASLFRLGVISPTGKVTVFEETDAAVAFQSRPVKQALGKDNEVEEKEVFATISVSLDVSMTLILS